MMALSEVGALIGQEFTDPRQLGDVLTIMKDFIKSNDIKIIEKEEGEKIK